MTESLYPTSALNGGRYRRTKAELAEIDTAIYEIAEAEEPVTVRGLFYRVMSLGLVPKPRTWSKPILRLGDATCEEGPNARTVTRKGTSDVGLIG